MTVIPYFRRSYALILSPLLLASALGTGHAIAAGKASQTDVRAGHGTRLGTTTGTTADYRAREQLAFFSFPTNAVGTTDAVKGTIVLDSHDRIVPAQSKFVIDLRTLKSDRSQRDQFIKANTLQTDQYPYAVFAVKKATGLPSTLPTSGTLHFSLIGNLTVHGVTRSTTWTATATLGQHLVTGMATTRVALSEFNMTPPTVGPVLSINNTITLEIHTRMTRTSV